MPNQCQSPSKPNWTKMDLDEQVEAYLYGRGIIEEENLIFMDQPALI
jgi:hypothetical protein